MAKGKFGGGGMPGNMNSMIKQAQKMQQDMLKAQQEIEDKEIEATAGGGAVTVKVSGKKELLSIKIDPDVIDADDIEILEDLIIAAVNEGMRKAEEISAEQMGKITGGMNIPGLF